MVSPTLPTLQQRRQLRRLDSDDSDTMSPTRSKASSATLEKREKCVRKELLYKLGFENNEKVPTLPSNREPSRGSLLGQVQTRTEPLKYDANFDKTMAEKKERALQRGNNVFSALGALFVSQTPPEPTPPEPTETPPNSVKDDDESDTASVTSSSDAASSKGRRKGIAFNDEVKVVPIPKRDEYSKRIRDRLWVNARELQSQVARNTVEFASEGWDWKNAFEDEHMYVCAETGEKVHPVHCEMEEED